MFKRTLRLCSGVTRAVVICGPFALKFPKGARGLRSNRYEAGIWNRNKDHPSRGQRLCPVLWCAPLGLLLIMQTAEPLPSQIDMSEVLCEDWWDYIPGGDEWPCEPKRTDWGLINGRVVAVDYAAPAV
jgi:hypothetical protein